MFKDDGKIRTPSHTQMGANFCNIALISKIDPPGTAFQMISKQGEHS
jgi:hypothetical protein